MTRHERYLREIAVAHGCTLTATGSTHWKLQHQSGWSVTCAASPRDPHWIDQLRRDIRRKQRGVYR